jgi:hypothetical protein
MGLTDFKSPMFYKHFTPMGFKIFPLKEAIAVSLFFVQLFIYERFISPLEKGDEGGCFQSYPNKMLKTIFAFRPPGVCRN